MLMVHSPHATHRAYLAVAAMLCMLMGCFGTGENAKPFDNESLRLLIVSAKSFPEISELGSNRIFNITEEQMTGIVAALSPITSAKVGKLPPEKVDYILSFQPGRNPMTFHVHLVDDHLVFMERQYLYEGGNAAAFKQAVDSIKAKNPGKSGMIVDKEYEQPRKDATSKTLS